MVAEELAVGSIVRRGKAAGRRQNKGETSRGGSWREESVKDSTTLKNLASKDVEFGAWCTGNEGLGGARIWESLVALLYRRGGSGGMVRISHGRRPWSQSGDGRRPWWPTACSSAGVAQPERETWEGGRRSLTRGPNRDLKYSNFSTHLTQLHSPKNSPKILI